MFEFCFVSGLTPTCTATSSTATVNEGNTTLTSAAGGKCLAGLTIRVILQIKSELEVHGRLVIMLHN